MAAQVIPSQIPEVMTNERYKDLFTSRILLAC